MCRFKRSTGESIPRRHDGALWLRLGDTGEDGAARDGESRMARRGMAAAENPEIDSI